MRERMIGFVYAVHWTILLVWLGLFFVPTSIWPGRIKFHFLLIGAIFAAEIVWGLYMKKYKASFDLICPLTTYMQYLRGYPLSEPKNYKHSFVSEAAGQLKLNVSYCWVKIMILVSVGIVTFQYFFT